MFVSGLPFLITSSRHIKLATAELVSTRTARQLAKLLMKVVLMYVRGGFVVNLALMDMEFEKIKDLCGLVEVNTTATREHVPEVERMIRIVKQRLRSVTSDFPFSPIAKMVLIHSVYHLIMMINAFPQDQGVTWGLLPRELVTGRTINYLRDCRATVGAYIEASMDAIIMNGQDNQTHSCIDLGASGNRQGSIKCFGLDTGKVVIRRTFSTMEWPDRLIRKANACGKKIKASVVKEDIKFLNRHGHRFEWDNEYIDEIEVIREDPNKVLPDVLDEIPRIELESDYDKVIGLALAPPQDMATTLTTDVDMAQVNAGLDSNSY